jgi:hypothetical protein
MGGWEGYKPDLADIGRIMLLPGTQYEVDRSSIPGYFNKDNSEKIKFYFKYKLFGLPFAGGWIQQPAYLMDILERLESESMKKKN